MPNTLAHFGVQGVLGHRFFKEIDPKWVFLGCVIPDIPWIVQRVVLALPVTIDLYDLRLYAICQASLFGCVVLAGAMACFFIPPKKAFFVLTINSFAHLLLDSSQLKWANGVHLFAPFSWELWNLGWYWPESVVTYGMTMLGLAYVVFVWRLAVAQPLFTTIPSWRNCFVGGLCGLVYVLFPFLVMSGAEQADNHFIKTLRETESRVGRMVEFDRVPFRKKDSENVIQTVARENLRVVTKLPSHSALVSVKGHFASSDTVIVDDLHIHSSWFRDAASGIGLALFIFLSLASMFRQSQPCEKSKIGCNSTWEN